VARVGSWSLNAADGEAKWSEQEYRLLGYAPEEVSASVENLLKVVPPEEHGTILEAMHRAFDPKVREAFHVEHHVLRPDGLGMVDERGEVTFSEQDQPLRMLGTTLDITERKRMETSLAATAAFVSHGGSEGFFKALVAHTAATFEMEYAHVGLRDGDAVQTLAVWLDGKEAERFRYESAETPCAYVLNREAIYFVRGVQQLFPQDHWLKLVGAESYVGEPIFDQNDEVIGLIAVLGRKPLESAELAQANLRILAARAGAEIIRRRNEERLRLAASVFSHAHEGIVITDPQARIVEVNDTFCTLSGYPREEVLGRNPRFLASGRHERNFWVGVWHSLHERGFWRGEVWNRRKDGDLIAEMLALSVVRNDEGEVTHYVGVLADITVLKESQSRLEEMAYYDALTRLPNRRLLADRMQKAMAVAERSGRLLAICYLDLDGFKPVNDNYGHELGDQLLTSVAGRLLQGVRGEDTVARLGGDEFALVLSGFESAEECARTLDRLLRSLALPHAVGEHHFEVTASVGVTLFPNDRNDPDALLRHADQAMYQAKQSGRNRYNFFDAEQDRQVNRHREQLARIVEAVENGELRLHYQPKVDMRLGEVYGVEALLRWRHPERGLLLPGDFLPLVEGQPLQQQIDDWVLTAGVDQLARWHAAGLKLSLSINCSAPSILREDFVAALGEILAAYPELPPGALELEILETAALEDLGLVTGVIERCAALGVSFALDDFGTGYSSLTYLRRLPAQILKIDRSFVHDMLQDAEDLAIVEGVIGLARAFQREVIAEGVETALHGALLIQLGCDRAQGFGIARPMPAAELPDWIARFQPPPLWSRTGVLRWSLDDVPLLTMEAEHRDWVERIAQRLRGELEVRPPPLDDRHCRFGQWYYDQGSRHYGDNALFSALEPLHQEVHRIGGSLLAQLEADPEGARLRLPELLAARDALLHRLHTLQRAMVERCDTASPLPSVPALETAH